MTYFLTVMDNHDRPLHNNEQHDTLESALEVVSANYLKNPPQPWRSNAFCAIKDGQIYRIKIVHDTDHFDLSLKPEIRYVEIQSAAQFLEAGTFIKDPE